MEKPDTVQRFMFEDASIRGEIAYLDETYKTIMHQHPYPAAIRRLLGEALIACLLVSSSIKFEGEVSLQFHGDKRLPLLLVQCDHQLRIRAFAKYNDTAAENDYQQAFLAGKMALIINQYNQTQAYESIVPIHSSSMADNLMHYFAQSEQIATRVWFALQDGKAAGMLLQLMPDSQKNSQQKEQFWEYAVQIGETITENELITLDNATILHRLYHETELRLYAARPVHFGCRCSLQKMQHILSVLGQKEIETLLQEQGHVRVNCDFCNQLYEFDAIDIALLFNTKSRDFVHHASKT